MIRYLDNIEDDAVTEVANFDYTHFLCEPRKEKECSIFHVLREHVSSLWSGSCVSSSNETFTHLARQSLSSIYSDVLNLSTLIQEARKQKFRELNILLPYALDDLELTTLREMTRVDIAQFLTDREFLRVTFY